MAGAKFAPRPPRRSGSPEPAPAQPDTGPLHIPISIRTRKMRRQSRDAPPITAMSPKMRLPSRRFARTSLVSRLRRSIGVSPVFVSFSFAMHYCRGEHILDPMCDAPCLSRDYAMPHAQRPRAPDFAPRTISPWPKPPALFPGKCDFYRPAHAALLPFPNSATF